MSNQADKQQWKFSEINASKALIWPITNAAAVCTRSTGLTPLAQAIDSEDISAAKLLVSLGADLNEKDINGFTPLIRAAHKGNSKLILLFLNKNISIDQTDQEGRTSLHWAANNGHADIVKLLLRYGATIDIISDHGETPLSMALEGLALLLGELQQNELGDLQTYPDATTANLKTVIELLISAALEKH